jgi:tripartite-type tricarboxylate transporter receptor subunit TctC
MFNTFKALSVGVSLVVSMASAVAQGFPQKPITLIVPVAAGGTTDIAGRILAAGIKAE